MVVTWDSVNKSTGVVLSNNNLTALVPNNVNTVRASVGRTSGKWYWEIAFVTLSNAMVGIVRETTNLNAVSYSTGGNAYYYVNGNKYPTNVSYGQSYTINDTLSVLLDMDLGTIEFWKNGISQGIAYNNLKDVNSPVYPAVTSGSGSAGVTTTARFNINEFTYQPPEGYLAYDGSRRVINKILLSANNYVYSLNNTTTKRTTNMTSNTTPSPFTTGASSVFSSSYPAWKAFDGLLGINDAWISANGTNAWIQLSNGSPIVLNKLELTSRGVASNSSTSAPKDFEIQASVNGTDFTTLRSVNNQIDWGIGEKREYYFNNDKEYTYYRINVTSNNGESYIAIGEILYYYVNTGLTEIPSYSEENIIKYGVDSPVKVDGIFTDKDYLLQDTVSENAEGLWTTKINRKPLSIKFN